MLRCTSRPVPYAGCRSAPGRTLKLYELSPCVMARGSMGIPLPAKGCPARTICQLCCSLVCLIAATLLRLHFGTCCTYMNTPCLGPNEVSLCKENGKADSKHQGETSRVLVHLGVRPEPGTWTVGHAPNPLVCEHFHMVTICTQVCKVQRASLTHREKASAISRQRM
jgi:hypothetical protein